MYGYFFRRLLGTIPVMLVVAVFIFLMLRLTPSDPAAVIAGDNATTEQVAQIRTQLGLDRPMVEQFFIWSGKVLRGDLGESFFFKKTVASLIGERIEPTLSLALFTMVLAVLIAVPLGVLAAHRQGSWIDRIVMGFSVLGFSMPSFVVAYLLIYLFAVDMIMSTASLPGWLQVVLIWLTGVVGWLLLRPYRRITQLGGKDGTAAISSAGSWHRRFFRDMREAAKLDVAEPGGTKEPVIGKGRTVYVDQSNLRPEARLEDPTHNSAGRSPAPSGRLCSWSRAARPS